MEKNTDKYRKCSIGEAISKVKKSEKRFDYCLILIYIFK